MMEQWAVLADAYPGWGLHEIQGLSSRERINWLSLAKEKRKVLSSG